MTIECSIGIIKESDKYLFSQRSKKPFLDYFEFPGGKLEANESSDEAIDREMSEELGIKIVDKIKIGSLIHLYNNLKIKIHVYKIVSYEGNILPREQQKILYLNPIDSYHKFIESTYRIINYISLPRYLHIISDEKSNPYSIKISRKYFNNMIRLRSFGLSEDSYINQAKKISEISSNKNAKLILDLKYIRSCQNIKYSGIHYTSNEISNIKTNIRIDKNITYSASCHNLKEIHMANQLNLDFILLSPVLSFKNDNPPLGWTDFKLLSKEANMPVFALGGISKDDLNTCMANDGYGVSGISKF